MRINQSLPFEIRWSEIFCIFWDFTLAAYIQEFFFLGSSCYRVMRIEDAVLS
jgi:hypothetical protein